MEYKELIWQVHYKGSNRCRSWGGWTFAGAFEMVAKWAWKRNLEPEGLEVLDCPIPGLFPVRTGDVLRDEELLAETYVIP